MPLSETNEGQRPASAATIGLILISFAASVFGLRSLWVAVIAGSSFGGVLPLPQHVAVSARSFVLAGLAFAVPSLAIWFLRRKALWLVVAASTVIIFFLVALGVATMSTNEI